MNRKRHGNFSRADFVFLLTSLGLLLALAPLLVGCAIDTSRQVTCKNNMRNLGVAANGFESAQSRYPGYDNLVGEKSAGWAVSLLPNLDHHDWYDEWRKQPEPPKW